MALLMMRGEPVLNALDYARLFDLYDALRGRASLVSFARTHLRMNYLDEHHCAMLRRAELGAELEDRRDFYWGAYEPRENLPAADARPSYQQERVARAFYDQTAAIAKAPERLRVCAAATAAVLLAGLEDPEPLDAARALDTWRGPARGIDFSRAQLGQRVDGDLMLFARKQPYALPALKSPGGALQIVTHRIDVLPVGQGNDSRFARLEALDEAVEVPRGGDVYVNTHEGRVVHILPNRVQNGGCEMVRQGNTLMLTGDGAARRIPGKGVTSFAPEAFEDGYLLIRDNRLDISHAWRRNTDANLQWLAARNGAVEVQTRGQYYLVLLANGRVISDNQAWDNQRGVARLDDVRR